MPYTSKSGLQIHYQVEGDPKKPPLLLGHGFGNSLKDWYSLDYVTSLAENFFLILVDGRGFGASDKPHDLASYKPKLLASDYIAVLDELQIKKCHYFGNSYGGLLGFALAKYYPERFSSFIIAGTRPYGDTQRPSSYPFVTWLKLGLAQGREAFIEALEKFLGKPFPPKIRTDYMNNDLAAMLAAMQTVWPDNSAGLKNSDVPCLLFVGENDPYLKEMHQFAEETPRCKFMVLPNMDHADVYWQGKISTPLIIDFLATIRND